MESYTLRPHITAFTIDTKLSSISTMSDASFATDVPVMPIAKPTLLFASAGPSFVPSPVTATTWCRSIRPVTSRCLSVGAERAITCSVSTNWSNWPWFFTTMYCCS